MTDDLIEASHIDWDRTDLLVPYFKIVTSQDGYWPCMSWSAYSDTLGPGVATVHGRTKQEAIEELIIWLEGYFERRYGAMWPEVA